MFRVFLSLFLLPWIVLTSFGQELKITSSPNPVAPGTSMRITVQSGFNLVAPTVTFLDVSLPLQRAGEGLYTASYTIPTAAKPGLVPAVLSFRAASARELRVPFQFEVLGAQAAVNQTLESRNVPVRANPMTEATIKIDQLEDTIRKLEAERQTLRQKAEVARREIESLKRAPRTTPAQLTEKEKKLQALDSELAQREKNLKNIEAQYERQLKELVARETALGEKEGDLKKRETELAKEKATVSAQLATFESRQGSLKEQETALQKRQKTIDEQELALRNQSQSLKDMQAKSERNASEIKMEKSKLQEQEKELEILRKELGQNDQNVKAREAEISKQRDSMQKRNAELDVLGRQIQAQQQLVSEADTALKRRMKEIDAAAKNLVEEKKTFDSSVADLKNREAAIIVQEENLKNQLRTLSARDEQLKNIQKTLKEEESALKKQQESVKGQQIQLDQKERELIKIQSEISSQNTVLQRLNQSVESDRTQLAAQTTALQQEKDVLNKQQQNLTGERQQLASQQQQAQALEASLQRRRLALDKDAENAKNLQEKDRQQLEMRRKELEAQELELREFKRTVSGIEAEQSRREQAFRQTQAAHEARERAFANRLNEFEAKQLELETVRKDVYAKYAALDELKNWVEKRTYELQEAYRVAQQDRTANTEVFEAQFQKLEHLTRMLQQRTRSLLELNKSLTQKNEELQMEIKSVVPTESQFTVSPYLGYRSFPADAGLKNEANIGAKFMGSFSRDWGFDTGVGFVSTLEKQRLQIVYTFDFLFSRELFAEGDFRIVGLAGLGGRISNQAVVGPAVGLGVRNPILPDLAASLDMIYGPDFLVRLGVDMRLRFDEQEKIKRLVEIPTADRAVDIGVAVLLTVPESRFQTALKKPVLKDASGHWSEKDARLVAAYGFLNLTPVTGESDAYMYFPNKQLTLLEGARLLTQATYLPKMMQDEAVSIELTIVDLPGVQYKTSLWIEDQEGKKIRYILDGETKGVGDLRTQWDGFDAEGKRVPQGKYLVRVSLTDRDGNLVVQNQSPLNVIDKASFDWNWSAKESVFTDIPPTHPDRPMLNAFIEMGNTPFVIRKESDLAYKQKPSQFNPDQGMTRVAFILALSNSLRYLGASSYAIADLSPYSDIKTFPEEIRDQVGLYISELDYGGDEKKRLRLYAPMTRAEAVTLAARFLHWQSKRFGYPLP